jgi:hypothetical protein
MDAGNEPGSANADERPSVLMLISGQATVLYGAATFSEDIDLWINPTLENARRFLDVLRSSSSLYYRLQTT